MEELVNFSVTVDNPDYRYGDLHRSSKTEVAGVGIISHWAVTPERCFAIVKSNQDGKFYRVNIENLQATEEDSL